MKEILTGIGDVIFPPRCLACGTLVEEHGPLPFCPPCLAGFRFIRSPLCPRCGLPFPVQAGGDHLCGECIVTKPPYAVARAMGYYDGTMLTAIHRFKYRGNTGIGKILGRMLGDFAAEMWDMEAFSLVLPVPLHKSRLRERGFNQAVVLARELAKRFSLPLDILSLKRRIITAAQVGLGREERLANVKGAFAVARPERIDGMRILLVDDVYTTGSTLLECARTLLKANADSVAVLTLARAVPDAGVVTATAESACG